MTQIMQKSNCLLFHLEQWPALDLLSDEKLGKLVRCLCQWYMDDEDNSRKYELSLDGDLMPLFKLLQVQSRIDSKKFQQKCELNRQNARRRWAKKEEDATACDRMLNKDKDKDNDKDKDKDNDKDKDKDKDNDKNYCSIAAVEKEKEKASAAASADLSSLIEKITKGFMPWYNKMLDDYGSQMPRIKVITPDRAKKVKAIVDSYGEKALQQAMCTAAGSAFLNGRGQKNKFLASFDWIIDPTHFLDVYEGKYNT